MTVRRIFQLFANGVSPRGIAHRLNDEAVPGPDCRPWLDTTIRGQKEPGTGILNNELYAGELVWNRCSYVKDPSTGRRLARPKPIGGVSVSMRACWAIQSCAMGRWRRSAR